MATSEDRNAPNVSPDKEHGPISPSKESQQNFWSYLNTEVDPKQCSTALGGYCFMTGFIDAISFSAVFVWCGFQTGNFAQLALALARLFERRQGGHDLRFHIADQQALCSLLTFILGAMVGRTGDRIGPKKRIWLMFGTFLQALLTMAAAIAIWQSKQSSVADDRGDPSWTNTLTFVGLGFMSASLGVQGILGKRLNTEYGTTIVLTTIWVDLFTLPQLFNIREKVISRDIRLIAAGTLFLGAFVGRALLGSIGAAGALGVGTGFRILMTFAWIFVPGKP